jgi:hypothetical protein
MKKTYKTVARSVEIEISTDKPRLIMEFIWTRIFRTICQDLFRYGCIHSLQGYYRYLNEDLIIKNSDSHELDLT